jgi:hypothetical protein
MPWSLSSAITSPTLVLKLDFTKAFDFVDWDCLFLIMAAHGFYETWLRWIKSILVTSKSVFLVNGYPGPWFSYKKGLRQGDPLSLYLFLLVTDVPQRLIHGDQGVQHPVDDHGACPVLQYADDTLILL